MFIYDCGQGILANHYDCSSSGVGGFPVGRRKVRGLTPGSSHSVRLSRHLKVRTELAAVKFVTMELLKLLALAPCSIGSNKCAVRVEITY